MWLTRRHLLAHASAGLACSFGAVARADLLPNLSSGPIAVRGFDVVSYFLNGPEPGLVAYEAAWAGKAWRFARAANREAFRRDPSSYAPRLGGFDPVGILAGRLVDTDPLVFARCPGPAGIERLYLLRNAEHRAQILTDPGLAMRAEARWPALRDQVERDFPE